MSVASLSPHCTSPALTLSLRVSVEQIFPDGPQQLVVSEEDTRAAAIEEAAALDDCVEKDPLVLRERTCCRRAPQGVDRTDACDLLQSCLRSRTRCRAGAHHAAASDAGRASATGPRAPALEARPTSPS